MGVRWHQVTCNDLHDWEAEGVGSLHAELLHQLVNAGDVLLRKTPFLDSVIQQSEHHPITKVGIAPHLQAQHFGLDREAFHVLR